MYLCIREGWDTRTFCSLPVLIRDMRTMHGRIVWVNLVDKVLVYEDRTVVKVKRLTEETILGEYLANESSC